MAKQVESAWGMVDAADEEIDTKSVDEVADVVDDEVTLLDVRDVRERWIEGTIPGSLHTPRGMLEFWADPETKYYRDYFDPDDTYVLFCNEAGRSALATKRLQEMGYENVAHLEGGFTAWTEAGQEIEEVEQEDYKNR